jgi:hypothetical protein
MTAKPEWKNSLIITADPGTVGGVPQAPEADLHAELRHWMSRDTDVPILSRHGVDDSSHAIVGPTQSGKLVRATWCIENDEERRV